MLLKINRSLLTGSEKSKFEILISMQTCYNCLSLLENLCHFPINFIVGTALIFFFNSKMLTIRDPTQILSSNFQVGKGVVHNPSSSCMPMNFNCKLMLLDITTFTLNQYHDSHMVYEDQLGRKMLNSDFPINGLIIFDCPTKDLIPILLCKTLFTQ